METKKNPFLTLKSRLAPMSWAQRIDYVWSYYKQTIVICVTLLVIILYLISGLIANRKQMQIGGLIANINLSEEGKAYLSQRYLEHLQGDPSKDKVELTTVELGDLKNEATMEQTYYGLTKTLALLTDHKIDYLVTDQNALELYMAQAVFLDLRQVLSEDVLSALEDKLIRLRPVDDNGNLAGEEYPVAINISHLPFVQDCTSSQNPIYFGVAANSPNKDGIQALWDYLNNWGCYREFSEL